MSKAKFAIGALIGAAAGIVAGMLTAPKSGKETRADLKAKATELKDAAKDQTEGLKGQSDDLVASLKDKIER